MTRVADTVAAVLHAHGVRHAFGMPGGEVVTLIDGLQDAGVTFHLARHETAAAIMAAGAWSMTGAPAALVATVGPGLANAVNGIADAAQEHVPLIVLSGIVDRPTRARYTHQVIDHAAMLRPLVKASFEIEPESAGPTVARALAIALTAPRGPVHLDLSPANAARPDPSPRVWPPVATAGPTPTEHDPAIVELASRLAAAERPLILAGFEIACGGGADALVVFAERIGAPVVTTYKGKGAFPEDHPLALGAAGLSPKADAALLPLFRASDLVLLVGYDPIEMRLGWLDPVDDAGRVVEITAAPADHGMHLAGRRLLADPEAALRALAARFPARRNGWPDGSPLQVRETLASTFATPMGFGPHAIVDQLQSASTDETVITVDSGAHRILLSQKLQRRRPMTLLQSAGFCTMAAALPLAIGAKIADPDRQVVAVMGDGGLEMGLGELATLRDLGLAITILLFQDESLALIALKQSQAGLKTAGVVLGATDFAAVARAFGGHGATVKDGATLANELAAARTRDTFTLIACRFPADAYLDAF